MQTTPIGPNDLARSVIAVPPLCLGPRLELAHAQNERMVRHIEAGGVSTILWGGNAQLQHWPVSHYGEFLAMAEGTAAIGTLVIPSAGPDYGRLLDQGRVLAGTRFPAAMMLPLATHWTAEGVARGVRDFVAAAGKPAIVYLRSADYLPPATLGALVASGEVAAIKYAVPRPDFKADPYLEALCAEIGAERIVSGFGELPAVPHLRNFGLAGFTAGCVCITPRLSTRVLEASKADEWADAERLCEPIRPLESLRERHSPIRVIHAAVRIAGIADTGPLYPMLSDVEPELEEPIREAVHQLQAAEAGPARAAA